MGIGTFHVCKEQKFKQTGGALFANIGDGFRTLSVFKGIPHP